MKTITVYADNSDHKLTQAEWCCFVNAIHGKIVRGFCRQDDRMIFHGASSSGSYRLNAAWVFECCDDSAVAIRDELISVARDYRTVTWIDGQVETIPSTERTSELKHHIHWVVMPGQEADKYSIDARKEPEGEYMTPLRTIECPNERFLIAECHEGVRYFKQLKSAEETVVR